MSVCFFQESAPVRVADIEVAVNGHPVEFLHYQEQEGRHVSRAYYQPKKVIQFVALHYMHSVIGIGQLPSHESKTFQTKL